MLVLNNRSSGRTKTSGLNSEQGFSLIELLVVVAIIGILAAISVPQVGKFMAKARQAEMRTMLSGLYTAEKAFQIEYGTFHDSFGLLGFDVTGPINYRVGFADGAAASAMAIPAGLVAPPVAANNQITTAGYCAGAGRPCNETLRATVAGGWPAAFIVVPTAVAFTAGAKSNIDDDVAVDQWTIDQNKAIVLRNDDIQN